MAIDPATLTAGAKVLTGVLGIFGKKKSRAQDAAQDAAQQAAKTMRERGDYLWKEATNFDPMKGVRASAEYGQKVAGNAIASGLAADRMRFGHGFNTDTRALPIAQRRLDDVANPLAAQIATAADQAPERRMQMLLSAMQASNPGGLAQTFKSMEGSGFSQGAAIQSLAEGADALLGSKPKQAGQSLVERAMKAKRAVRSL